MSLDVSIRVPIECPHCSGLLPGDEEHSQNITHNLGKMAGEAGIYEALWRPYLIVNPHSEDLDYQKAYEIEDKTIVRCKDIYGIIEKGLVDMLKRPAHYKKFDSPNGWGTYENFVPWIEKYLKKLEEYPDYLVTVSR